MGRIDQERVAEIVSDLRSLAEGNKDAADAMEDEALNEVQVASTWGAGRAYEDAADYVEQELLDDHTERD